MGVVAVAATEAMAEVAGNMSLKAAEEAGGDSEYGSGRGQGRKP